MAGKRHFLLVGNASYLNRGCEAIVRGTMEILRAEFGHDIRVTLASYMPAEVARRQAQAETDPAIRHVRLAADRFSAAWALSQLNRRLGAGTAGVHLPIARAVRTADVAMEVGGDNFSLDYGRPVEFVEMDRYILKRGVPLVLWGASVGPFDKDPEFAETAFPHLRKMAGIFVREPLSIDYLKSKGVESNVYRVADPAFCMRPLQPSHDAFPHDIRPGAIGINLSPLIGDFVSNGDSTAWFKTCVETVSAIARQTDRDIHLVPHVMMSGYAVNDGPAFHTAVASEIEKATGRRLPVWKGSLSAAELKWGISRLDVFAGGRMHSTIAALSSCVPTLSLAYSVKALGITQDVYGTLRYCLPPEKLEAREMSRAILALISEADEVRGHLKRVMPDMIQRSLNAGRLLRQVMEGRGKV